MIAAPQIELITEDWLKSVGFKWDMPSERDGKHWTLWFGQIAATNIETGERESFSDDTDLGIELAPTCTGDSWHCWLRADYSGRYSRFIHLRHIRYKEDVVIIVQALSNRPWNPNNHMYGAIFSPQQAGRIRERDQRLDMKIVKASPWREDEKDETKATRNVRPKANS